MKISVLRTTSLQIPGRAPHPRRISSTRWIVKRLQRSKLARKEADEGDSGAKQIEELAVWLEANRTVARLQVLVPHKEHRLAACLAQLATSESGLNGAL